MSVYLPEVENIYFAKTKEYFQEVMSSYAIGNYRSATVMLYSVAICDIMFKLQELKDMYNDSIATEILGEVDRNRSINANGSKSKWEKEFVDSVYKKTKLLDLEAYTNLNHLYDHRNFSAHPAINENYELIAPSKETTIANIRNILKDILVKPPIFIKKIVDALTEDLRGKGEVYQNAKNDLRVYLNNKYFSRMPESMKKDTLKAFWKFCFCLPEDRECKANLHINRTALEILLEGFENKAMEHIKLNADYFSVAVDEDCQLNLVSVLYKFPKIFDCLNADAQAQINKLLDDNDRVKPVAWFKFPRPQEHFSYLKSKGNLRTTEQALKTMIEHYTELGEEKDLIDFLVWLYGESGSFDTANIRFNIAIEPFLHKMSREQFEQLIRVTDENDQIRNRNAAYDSNNKIIRVACEVLDKNFDFSKYPRFRFDKELLCSQEGTSDVSTDDDDDDLPF